MLAIEIRCEGGEILNRVRLIYTRVPSLLFFLATSLAVPLHFHRLLVFGPGLFGHRIP